jgi:hypothetical protein
VLEGPIVKGARKKGEIDVVIVAVSEQAKLATTRDQELKYK